MLSQRFFFERIPAPKVFLQKLRQKGFTRLLFPKGKNFSLNQVKNIEDIKSLPRKNFYLLLDRFVIEEKQKGRLRDSLKQAFDLPKIFSSDQGIFSEEILVQTLNGEQRAFFKKIKMSAVRL